jgi:short-subunit dehydrogenase
VSSSAKPLAVVTGASSGIGLELAKQFADHGFDLLIAAEDDGLEAATTELVGHGAEVQSIQADLSEYDGVERLAAAIASLGDRVEAVAINAGVGVGGDFARATSLEAELRLIRLNVSSTVHLAKRVLPAMIDRGAGRVLFSSSIAGTMPAPFEAVYGASKAFVLSFSDALRDELRDTGVTVTALMPGPTETNFFHRAGMDDTRVGAGEKADAEQVAEQAYDALMAGDGHVIAGPVKTKLQGLANEILPEKLKAVAHRAMSEPGSADEA